MNASFPSPHYILMPAHNSARSLSFYHIIFCHIIFSKERIHIQALCQYLILLMIILLKVCRKQAKKSMQK